jgi:hypothetical protein
MGDTSERRIDGGSDGQETSGEVAQFITMRHPYIKLVIDTLEQGIYVGSCRSVTGDSQDGMAILLAIASADITAVIPGDLLKTIADTKNRNLRIWSMSVSIEIFCARL